MRWHEHFLSIRMFRAGISGVTRMLLPCPGAWAFPAARPRARPQGEGEGEAGGTGRPLENFPGRSTSLGKS